MTTTTTTEQDELAIMVGRVQTARSKAATLLRGPAVTADGRSVLLQIRKPDGEMAVLTVSENTGVATSTDNDGLAVGLAATFELARLAAELLEFHLHTRSRKSKLNPDSAGRTLPTLPVMYDHETIARVVAWLNDTRQDLEVEPDKVIRVKLLDNTPDGVAAIDWYEGSPPIHCVMIMTEGDFARFREHLLSCCWGSVRRRDYLLADLQRGLAKRGDLWGTEHSVRVDP